MGNYRCWNAHWPSYWLWIRFMRRGHSRNCTPRYKALRPYGRSPRCRGLISRARLGRASFYPGSGTISILGLTFWPRRARQSWPRHVGSSTDCATLPVADIPLSFHTVYVFDFTVLAAVPCTHTTCIARASRRPSWPWRSACAFARGDVLLMRGRQARPCRRICTLRHASAIHPRWSISSERMSTALRCSGMTHIFIHSGSSPCRTAPPSPSRYQCFPWCPPQNTQWWKFRRRMPGHWPIDTSWSLGVSVVGTPPSMSWTFRCTLDLTPHPRRRLTLLTKASRISTQFHSLGARPLGRFIMLSRSTLGEKGLPKHCNLLWPTCLRKRSQRMSQSLVILGFEYDLVVDRIHFPFTIG